MKKKNGFTLIELLAVVVILGILLSIATISVNTIRKKQEEKNKVNVISSILTGAKEYNAKYKFPVEGKTVKELKEANVTDFDENKYKDLLDLMVTKEICSDNNLKVSYYLTVGDTSYNDCGCEKQEAGLTSKEICTNKD